MIYSGSCIQKSLFLENMVVHVKHTFVLYVYQPEFDCVLPSSGGVLNERGAREFSGKTRKKLKHFATKFEYFTHFVQKPYYSKLIHEYLVHPKEGIKRVELT